MGAELPRLCGLLHLLGVKTLVYHSRYLAVSTKRQPPHTVCRVALLWLELKDMKPWVEEKIKLLNPYAKELGKKKMSSLVYQHQQRY